MTDLKTMIQQAQRPEKSVQVCLRGDLVGRHEDLQRDLADVSRHATAKLAGDGGRSTEIAAEMQALEEEMRESTLTVVLRALPRREFTKLLANHPPRKENDQDRQIGVNADTFFDAMIASCWVSPELDREDRDQLLEALTSRQYADLSDAAWGVNRHEVNVPFSLTASRITQNSGETQKRQHDSASASNGSQGGSRKKSPSTSTKKDG